MTSSNVIWHSATVDRTAKEKLNGHCGVVLWFTGLPSSGKSTIAHAVEEMLYKRHCHTFVLDGDNVRHGLCRDLGFSRENRGENIRRVGEVAKLFAEAGIIVLTAFISPFRRDRERVRGIFQRGDFCEIYCRCPLAVCEQRDVKGHYQRARAGEIPDFTGISSPYEQPRDPELELDTWTDSVHDNVERVRQWLESRAMIKPYQLNAKTLPLHRSGGVQGLASGDL